MRTSDKIFLYAGNYILRRHNVLDHLDKDKRFAWTFNATPVICAILWDQICPMVNVPGATPTHFMWTLLFMNLYPTDGMIKTLTGADPKTFRKWVWKFMDAMSDMTPEVFQLARRFENRKGMCTISVDGVDFIIWEPRPFNEKYYSKKSNGPGLRYEIAICIATGYVVWVNGPFPAATHDLTIFRQGLMHEIEIDERVLGDRGYNGEPDYIVTATRFINEGNMQLLRDYHVVRARHETFNRRMKVWNVLGHRFRNDLSRHGIVFNAVAVIEQIKMEHGHPMFPVEWEDYGLWPVNPNARA